MEIARLVEQNRTILSVGLHLNFADARTRVAVHLERNLDKGTIAGVHFSRSYFTPKLRSGHG